MPHKLRECERSKIDFSILAPQPESTQMYYRDHQIFKMMRFQFGRSDKKNTDAGGHGCAAFFKIAVKLVSNKLASSMLVRVRLRVLLWFSVGDVGCLETGGDRLRSAINSEEQGVTQRTRPLDLPVARITHE
jgi:hypothetical protein